MYGRERKTGEKKATSVTLDNDLIKEIRRRNINLSGLINDFLENYVYGEQTDNELNGLQIKLEKIEERIEQTKKEKEKELKQLKSQKNLIKQRIEELKEKEKEQEVIREEEEKEIDLEEAVVRIARKYIDEGYDFGNMKMMLDHFSGEFDVAESFLKQRAKERAEKAGLGKEEFEPSEKREASSEGEMTYEEHLKDFISSLKLKKRKGRIKKITKQLIENDLEFGMILDRYGKDPEEVCGKVLKEFRDE